MNVQELIELQAQFDPHLRSGDYSFIGPSDPQLFNEFQRRTNEIATIKAFTREYHHYLGDREAILTTISTFPNSTEYRIFVVLSEGKGTTILMHLSIEAYCKRFNIDFE